MSIPIVVDTNNLVDNGWLKEHTDDILKMQLTDKTFDALNIINENLETIAEKLRNSWEGTKPGAQSSENATLNRLRLFVRQFPKYDEMTILVAAQMYVDREASNADYKYLKSTVNFIMEQDNFGDYQSKLADFCESVLQDEGISDTYTRA